MKDSEIRLPTNGIIIFTQYINSVVTDCFLMLFQVLSFSNGPFSKQKSKPTKLSPQREGRYSPIVREMFTVVQYRARQGRRLGAGGVADIPPQEAKYVESWPDTTSAWAS